MWLPGNIITITDLQFVLIKMEEYVEEIKRKGCFINDNKSASPE